MSLTRAFLLLLGSLLLATPAATPAVTTPDDPLESVLTMSVEGTLVIEQDGSVGSYNFSTPLSDEFKAKLGTSVGKWHFHPVLVDGAAVRAESRMRISLVAKPLGKDYEVSIENVVFPNPGSSNAKGQSEAVKLSRRRINPPRYPSGLERAAVSGRVLLAMRFGIDGKVQDVAAVQSMLYNVRGRDHTLAVAIRQFEDSALRAARQWTAEVQVKPGATTAARDFTAYIAVQYLMMDGPYAKNAVPAEAPSGQWRQITRTPKRVLPWLAGEDAVQDVGVADLNEGEMLPLAGAPEFVSPVAHTLL